MPEVPLDAMVDLVSQMVEESEADGSITREESGGAEEFLPIYEDDSGNTDQNAMRTGNSPEEAGTGSDR